MPPPAPPHLHTPAHAPLATDTRLRYLLPSYRFHCGRLYRALVPTTGCLCLSDSHSTATGREGRTARHGTTLQLFHRHGWARLRRLLHCREPGGGGRRGGWATLPPVWYTSPFREGGGRLTCRHSAIATFWPWRQPCWHQCVGGDTGVGVEQAEADGGYGGEDCQHITAYSQPAAVDM